MERRGKSPWCELREGARILFLLEAPGSQEMYENRPVVGPAGNVLWQCASAVGVFRHQTTILNVFPASVSKNERDGSIALRGKVVFGKKGFTPDGMEYVERAREIIREARPNVIVAFGVPALSALYKDPRLQKLRGSVLWSDEVDCKFITTVHPAFVLRGNAIYRHVLGADLARARRESETRELIRTNRTLHLEPSPSQALEFLREARASGICATDIENYGPQMDCFSVATSPHEAMCFPLWPAVWSDWDQVKILRAYAELLGDEQVTKINHNLLYDLWFLYQQYKIVPCGPLFDTMVAFSVMYPTMTRETSGTAFERAGNSDKETAGFPKALHFVTSLYANEPYYKDEGHVLVRPDGSSDYSGRHRYNALDSAVAFECAEGLSPELDERGYRTAHDLTVNQIASAILIQAKGIKVDLDAFQIERRKISTRMAELQEQIEGLVGGKINLASPAQLCKYFYDTLGVRPYLSKEGRPTCDENALIRIRRRDELPECDLILEWRNLHTFQKMFLDVKLDGDDRFRTSIDLRGSRFGRWATSKTVFGTGGNFQNLDPRLRSFLVVD